MSNYHPDLNKLRGYWQFANVCEFFQLFGDAYNLQDFDTDVFEGELIRQDKEKMTFYLNKLCNNLRSSRGFKVDSWELVIKKELSKIEDGLPINPNFEDFFSLTLFQQIVCFQILCDLQFRDSYEKLRNAAGGDDAYEDLRVEPIGEDKKGNLYFLFDDNRLYVQKLAARPPKKTNVKAFKKYNEKKEQALKDGESLDDTWEPVCITLEEWEKFPKQFENSRNINEKELHAYLMEDVVPQVTTDLKTKLREVRKKQVLAQMIPKRSSRLQEKEKLKKEEEMKLKQQRMIDAISNDENLDIIREHPTVNTREMRAKRRALRGIGDSEGIKDLHKQIINDSYGDKSELQGTNEEELIDVTGEDFQFECICGQYGHNFDDGTEQICCDKCNVWQHLGCQELLDDNGNPIESYNDIPFLCHKCKNEDNQGTESNTSKTNYPPLKIRLNFNMKKEENGEDLAPVDLNFSKVISTDFKSTDSTKLEYEKIKQLPDISEDTKNLPQPNKSDLGTFNETTKKSNGFHNDAPNDSANLAPKIGRSLDDTRADLPITNTNPNPEESYSHNTNIKQETKVEHTPSHVTDSFITSPENPNRQLLKRKATPESSQANGANPKKELIDEVLAHSQKKQQME